MQELASRRRQIPLSPCKIVPAEDASIQKTVEKLGAEGF